MRTKDDSLRDTIHANHLVKISKMKSKAVPGLRTVDNVELVSCPLCRKERWAGWAKRHYCDECRIWFMVDSYGVLSSSWKMYVSTNKECLGMTDIEKNIPPNQEKEWTLEKT